MGGILPRLCLPSNFVGCIIIVISCGIVFCVAYIFLIQILFRLLGELPPNGFGRLLEGIKFPAQGVRWNVGDVRSIKFWEDKCIPSLSGFRVSSHCPQTSQWKLVSDFIDSELGSWRFDSLRAAGSNEDMQVITIIPTSINGDHDRLVWHFSNSGAYTVKSGYVMSEKQVTDTIGRLYGLFPLSRR